jgi:hypothetical protein
MCSRPPHPHDGASRSSLMKRWIPLTPRSWLRAMSLASGSIPRMPCVATKSDSSRVRAAADLAERAGITFAQFVMLTPYPGTVDFERWEREVGGDATTVSGIPVTRHWLIPQADRRAGSRSCLAQSCIDRCMPPRGLRPIPPDVPDRLVSRAGWRVRAAGSLPQPRCRTSTFPASDRLSNSGRGWHERVSMRRFTRLTNAFSKMLENHAAMVALYFMFYNFGRVHQALRVTPAMEAGISDHVWAIEEVIALL